MKDPRAPWIVRENRQALYVSVRTVPPLREVWSVNISRGGIGLEFARRADETPPPEGSEITVEFTLPETQTSIRARGIVCWLHDWPAQQGGAGALGVRFTDPSGSAVAALASYLSGQRFHVAVCLADPAEHALLVHELGEEVHLHFADSLSEVEDVLARGDISVALLFAESTVLLQELLVQVDRGVFDFHGQGISPLRDLRPRIIICGNVDPTIVLDLFNRRQVFSALPVPLSRADLTTAVIKACEDFGVRTEQRRATLALQRALHREVSRHTPSDDRIGSATGQLVFVGPAIKRVIELAQIAAPHKVGVLLQGETGTGKEVLAQLVHELSPRSASPFVVQDCGTLTETLLESELFGHVKGSFTGAIANHPGLFVLADGGSVFLDEIENTTPKMQAQLLRTIETGEVRPVGGTQIRRVDIRLIAASNRGLAEEVRSGRFRADLFYRLNGFPIDVPPLRERREDVLPLAQHFLTSANKTFERQVPGFTDAAQEVLLSYAWPGNIRELRNVIERAVLLCKEDRLLDATMLVGIDHDAATSASPRGARGQLRDKLDATEADTIRAALERNNHVVRRAARELGVNAVTLGRKIKRLGL